MKTINSSIRTSIDLHEHSSCSAEHRRFMKRASRRQVRNRARAAGHSTDPVREYLDLKEDQAAMRRPRLTVVAPPPEMERGDGTAKHREVLQVNGVTIASTHVGYRRAA